MSVIKTTLFLFAFVFFLILTQANATSTTFDQNIILKLSDEGVNINEGGSINSNLQSIFIAGTINYFGNKMFETGYFYPFGLIPQSITNLSPLAYLSDQTNKRKIYLFYNCKGSFNEDYKKKNRIRFEFLIDDKDCKVKKTNNIDKINNLIGRYY